MKIKSYTKKKGVFSDYFEVTIYDDDNPSNMVKAVGKTEQEARKKAEEAWRNKQLER